MLPIYNVQIYDRRFYIEGQSVPYGMRGSPDNSTKLCANQRSAHGCTLLFSLEVF